MSWGRTDSYGHKLCPLTIGDKYCIDQLHCSTQQKCIVESVNKESEQGKISSSVTHTVTTTLIKRGYRYGDFTENAIISQEFKDLLSSFRGWNSLDKVKKEALTVIMQKIARILNGDPNYKDNWHDIAGYATLAEERCTSSGEEQHRDNRA